VTYGGNNLNDFPENKLTKSRVVYTVNANRGPKFVCRLRRTGAGVTITQTELTSFHCHTLVY